jgi:hypothetical protein
MAASDRISKKAVLAAECFPDLPIVRLKKQVAPNKEVRYKEISPHEGPGMKSSGKVTAGPERPSTLPESAEPPPLPPL